MALVEIDKKLKLVRNGVFHVLPVSFFTFRNEWKMKYFCHNTSKMSVN